MCPRPRAHRRREAGDSVEYAGQVDGQGAVERIRVDVGDLAPVGSDAGVVHKDVHWPERSLCLRLGARPTHAVADIEHLAAEAALVTGHLRFQRFAVDVGDGDGGAASGERLGDAEPNAARPARHEGVPDLRSVHFGVSFIGAPKLKPGCFCRVCPGRSCGRTQPRGMVAVDQLLEYLAPPSRASKQRSRAKVSLISRWSLEHPQQ